jgi:hypothetical protein
MTSRDLSLTTITTEFRLYQKPFQLPAKLFHEVLVCERIYHSVEREFANFKFSEPSLYLVNLCGTTSLLTAKYNFKSYICFMSDKLLTSINYPSDLRLLDEAQLQLAQELRNFIIDVVSVKKDISAPV